MEKSHWFGRSKMKPIDADKFMKQKEFRKIINPDKQSEYESKNVSATDKYSAVS